MEAIDYKIKSIKNQINNLQYQLDVLKAEKNLKGISVAKLPKNFEKYKLELLSEAQKELYFALKARNKQKVTDWCTKYSAYPTIATFKILSILKYRGDIFSNDEFLLRIKNEGITKHSVNIEIND